jgi:hypothetical protein
MNNIRIWGAVVGVAAFLILRGHLFVSMPQMARAADGQLVVGATNGDHARYVVGDHHSFSATSLGMEMSFTGSGELEHLGSRGVLSYMDPGLYASTAASARCQGSCMAGPLNAYESQGRIGHLILIPANDQALSAMKKADLPMGSKFQLSGNELTYQSGVLQGHSFNGQLGNTGYFLVDSIAPVN